MENARFNKKNISGVTNSFIMNTKKTNADDNVNSGANLDL